MQPVEVDRESPANDHLGDYVETSDPYPATRAAHAKALREVPAAGHADPEEVQYDMAAYAAAPSKAGTQVRPVTASAWYPATRLLTSGAQGFLLVESDPLRTRTVITNFAEDGIFLAPTPTRSPGDGSLFLPGWDPLIQQPFSVEIRSSARIYLFTPSGFTAGGAPVHVQFHTERWG